MKCMADVMGRESIMHIAIAWHPGPRDRKKPGPYVFDDRIIGTADRHTGGRPVRTRVPAQARRIIAVTAYQALHVLPDADDIRGLSVARNTLPAVSTMTTTRMSVTLSPCPSPAFPPYATHGCPGEAFCPRHGQRSVQQSRLSGRWLSLPRSSTHIGRKQNTITTAATLRDQDAQLDRMVFCTDSRSRALAAHRPDDETSQPMVWPRHRSTSPRKPRKRKKKASQQEGNAEYELWREAG
nr:hypothetical protein CFP56_32213 [Quercus suber]